MKNGKITKFVFVILILAVMLSGCSSGGSGSSSSMNVAEDENADAYKVSGDDMSGTGYDADTEEAATAVQSENGGNNEQGGSGNSQGQAGKAETQNANEKLVYKASVSIDTTEWDTSIEIFNKMLKEYECFVENKNVRDDGGEVGYENYYAHDKNYNSYEEIRKKRKSTMTARIRVPAKNYEAFMSKKSDIGDVRASNEEVTNMTRQYGTLQSQLAVYESEYKTYMKMLADTKDEKIMLSIQSKITEISAKIAEIKSGMESIDTDVSYSIVDMTIKEVDKKENVMDTSSFFGRLKSVAREGWDNFTNFLEGVLFFIILNWYLIILLALFVTAVVLTVKISNKRSREKMEERRKMMEMQRQQQSQNVPDDTQNNQD